jgi:hypothetical protein
MDFRILQRPDEWEKSPQANVGFLPMIKGYIKWPLTFQYMNCGTRLQNGGFSIVDRPGQARPSISLAQPA